MKAEHRKELQTNALADRIGRFFKGLGSKGSSGTWLMIGLIVVAVGGLIAAWLMIGAANRSARSKLWVSLDRLTEAEQVREKNPLPFGHPKIGPEQDLDKKIKRLDQIIEDNPGTKAALMARFIKAEINLRTRGLDQVMDRFMARQALDSLKKAREEYIELAEECKEDPYWGPQALLGIAKTVETQAAEDIKKLDEAMKLYKDLADNHSDSAAGKAAAARLKQLQDKTEGPRIKSFYREMGAELGLGRDAG